MIYQYNEYPALKYTNLYKKYKHDAGWDIRTPTTIKLLPEESQVIHTGLHICIPKGMKGVIQSRSGGAINNMVEASNAGVIDCGFTGECCVRLYNNSQSPVEYAPKDRIAQIVFDQSHTVTGWDWLRLQWALYSVGIPQVIPEMDLDYWPKTGRGDAGLGDSGLA